jgi:topoisomerase-4 subunit B
MAQSYTASDIEVLSGLDPVRRRPGMYTDTSRPNHLAHEVIDNSVDEALSGHAKRIDVVLYKDGSLEVATTAAACRSTFTRRKRSAASS